MQGMGRAVKPGGFMTQVLAQASICVTASLAATLLGNLVGEAGASPLASGGAAEGLEAVLHTRVSSEDLQTHL